MIYQEIGKDLDWTTGAVQNSKTVDIAPVLPVMRGHETPPRW